MKEQEVYVKSDGVSNYALIEYADDIWSRTSSYLKPTTGILLTKEELVKLIRESFDAGWAAMNTYATDSYWTDENISQEREYLLKTKKLI